MGEMPIMDSSNGGKIDWSKPQPVGVYRCQEGWSDTSGADWGCGERGITEGADGNLRCMDHALICELAGIREALVEGHEIASNSMADALGSLDASLESIADSLSWIKLRSVPRWRRLWWLLGIQERINVRRGRKRKDRYEQQMQSYQNLADARLIPTSSGESVSQDELDAYESCRICWPYPCAEDKHAEFGRIVSKTQSHD